MRRAAYTEPSVHSEIPGSHRSRFQFLRSGYSCSFTMIPMRLNPVITDQLIHFGFKMGLLRPKNGRFEEIFLLITVTWLGPTPDTSRLPLESGTFLTNCTIAH